MYPIGTLIKHYWVGHPPSVGIVVGYDDLSPRYTIYFPDAFVNPRKRIMWLDDGYNSDVILLIPKIKRGKK